MSKPDTATLIANALIAQYHEGSASSRFIHDLHSDKDTLVAKLKDAETRTREAQVEMWKAVYDLMSEVEELRTELRAGRNES